MQFVVTSVLFECAFNELFSRTHRGQAATNVLNLSLESQEVSSRARANTTEQTNNPSFEPGK